MTDNENQFLATAINTLMLLKTASKQGSKNIIEKALKFDAETYWRDIARHFNEYALAYMISAVHGIGGEKKDGKFQEEDLNVALRVLEEEHEWRKLRRQYGEWKENISGWQYKSLIDEINALITRKIELGELSPRHTMMLGLYYAEIKKRSQISTCTNEPGIKPTEGGDENIP